MAVAIIQEGHSIKEKPSRVKFICTALVKIAIAKRVFTAEDAACHWLSTTRR